jgi:hypothetical protein
VSGEKPEPKPCLGWNSDVVLPSFLVGGYLWVILQCFENVRSRASWCRVIVLLTYKFHSRLQCEQKICYYVDYSELFPRKSTGRGGLRYSIISDNFPRLGLFLTYLALFLMDGHGQPALLYLVPCTLGECGHCCLGWIIPVSFLQWNVIMINIVLLLFQGLLWYLVG